MSPALAYAMPDDASFEDRPMRCNLSMLSKLLLQQWKKLTPERLQQTRFSKRRIARMIEEEYGVHHTLAESYLSNLERSLRVVS